MLLTPAGVRLAKDSARAKAYLEEILNKIGADRIAAANVHVVVNVYSSLYKNAAARDANEPFGHRRYLGVADDGKPVYEIRVLQGLLPVFASEDEVAFLLGHELAHVLLEHVKPTQRLTDDETFMSWVSMQLREIEADLAAMDYLVGHYDLEAASSFLERLLAESNQKVDTFWRMISSHHHPSLRLALCLGRAQKLRRTDPKASARAPTPLDAGRLVSRRSPRDETLTLNPDPIRRRFFTVLGRVLAPREDRLELDKREFVEDQEESAPPVRFTVDLVNVLFQESLQHIQGLDLRPVERIERVIEVMKIFGSMVWVEPKPMQHNVALSSLSPESMRALEAILRKFTFGEANQWSVAELLLEYDRRIGTPRGPNLQTVPFEAVAEEIGFKSTRWIFEKLAKVSPRWRDLLHPPIHILLGDPLAAIDSKLRSAHEHAFAPGELALFLGELNAISLGDRLRSEGLKAVQETHGLGRIHSGTKNEGLHAGIVAWLARDRKPFVAALLTELDRLMKLDFATLDGPAQIEAAREITNLFGERNYDRGLRTEEVRGHGPLFHEWLERNDAKIKGEAREEFATLRLTFAKTIARDLFPLGEDRHARLAVVSPQLRHIGSKQREPLLALLDDNELLGLLDAIPATRLQGEKTLGSVARLTSVPLAEVKTFGYTRKLIDHALDVGGGISAFLTRVEALRDDGFIVEDAIRASDADRATTELLLASPEFARRFKGQFEAERLLGLLRRRVKAAHERRIAYAVISPKYIEWLDESEREGGWSAHAEFLFASLLALQRQGLPLAKWFEIYQLLARADGVAPEAMPLEVRNEISNFLVARLQGLDWRERRPYLLSRDVIKLLPVESAADFLADHLVSLAKGGDLWARGLAYRALREELGLAKRFTDLDVLLKRKLAERWAAQPGELKTLFGSDEKMHVEGVWIRGISGLIGEIQDRSASEQIEFIEYVTGRVEVVPACVREVAERLRKNLDTDVRFEDIVLQVRARFARATNAERGMTLLPFFTGDRSLASTSTGLDALIDHILANVSIEKRPLARSLARSIARAEGRNTALALAFVLGMKSDSGQALSEGEILRALLSYGYGVPGIKFGQYLAFTSDFKELLGELQDQAMPLSYFEAIVLLEKHYPRGLPNGYRVIGIKGSGSVNIGIEISNPETKASEILTVPREGIEIATRDDFRRLRAALLEAVKDPETERKFGFMLGLLDTIRDSVELEFNRARVFETHRALAGLLDREVRGWRVKMVEAKEFLGGELIRMQMASGTPARVLEREDPALYRRAMAAASRVITDHMLRVSKVERYFADSDFHDGQAFIDASTKTVWLIDPGQAVEIERDQFELAKLILKMLSKRGDLDRAVRDLNTSILNPNDAKNYFTREEIASLLDLRTPNEAFVRFISLASTKGLSVPLATVQWVLGMNRQRALAKRVGRPLDRALVIESVKDSVKSFFKVCN